MSDPVEIMERRLGAVVDGREDPRGLHFFCQIGGYNHDYGMTTLQVSGTGLVLLGWKDGEDRTLFSVQLADDSHQRFYAMLQEHPFWHITPVRRTRQQDEMNVHLRLTDQGQATWSGLQFWHTDLDEFSALRELMLRLNRLIEAIAGDDIPRFDWAAL